MADPGDPLSKLERDERVRFDTEALDDSTFRVTDVDKEDIGLTEVVAVGLVSGCDTYVLQGATHSSTCELKHTESDASWDLEVTNVVLVEES